MKLKRIISFMLATTAVASCMLATGCNLATARDYVLSRLAMGVPKYSATQSSQSSTNVPESPSNPEEITWQVYELAFDDLQSEKVADETAWYNAFAPNYDAWNLNAGIMTYMSAASRDFYGFQAVTGDKMVMMTKGGEPDVFEEGGEDRVDIFYDVVKEGKRYNLWEVDGVYYQDVEGVGERVPTQNPVWEYAGEMSEGEALGEWNDGRYPYDAPWSGVADFFAYDAFRYDETEKVYIAEYTNLLFYSSTTVSPLQSIHNGEHYLGGIDHTFVDETDNKNYFTGTVKVWIDNGKICGFFAEGNAIGPDCMLEVAGDVEEPCEYWSAGFRTGGITVNVPENIPFP